MKKRRVQSLRRDANDMVRDESGKVSLAKVGLLIGFVLSTALLFKHSEYIIDRWEALLILLSVLVAPDSFKKLVNLKYGNGK